MNHSRQVRDAELKDERDDLREKVKALDEETDKFYENLKEYLVLFNQVTAQEIWNELDANISRNERALAKLELYNETLISGLNGVVGATDKLSQSVAKANKEIKKAQEEQ